MEKKRVKERKIQYNWKTTKITKKKEKKCEFKRKIKMRTKRQREKNANFKKEI